MIPEPLRSLVPVAAFLFGATIGSFLNVVIYRLPRDEEGLTIAYPAQSFCPQCKEPIRGYDNIPLLSYFVLAGKCRKCKAKIPLRYFFVELLTACLFAVMALRHEDELGITAVYSLVTAALIACTFIDIDLRIIPDKIDIPGMLLAPLAAAIVPSLHVHQPLPDPVTGRTGAPVFLDLAHLGAWTGLPLPLAVTGSPDWDARLNAVLCALLGILAGAGTIWTIGVLGSKVFRKEAMGFGDVKLLGMIGGFLGWEGVLLALLLGCLVGALIGVVVKLVTEDPYIPFGPFLSLGAVGLMLARPDIVWVIFEWYPRMIRGH